MAEGTAGGGPLSTVWGTDQLDPFHARMLPLLSPAIQNPALVQETDSSCPWVSWSCGCDHDDPFHMAVPPPSVATQKPGSAHDELVGPPHAPTVPDHPDPLYLNASPSPFTAAQKLGVAQARDCNRAEPTGAGTPHDDPFHAATWGAPVVAMQNPALTHDTYALPAGEAPMPRGRAPDQYFPVNS
jgi:hypothetical protein